MTVIGVYTTEEEEEDGLKMDDEEVGLKMDDEEVGLKMDDEEEDGRKLEEEEVGAGDVLNLEEDETSSSTSKVEDEEEVFEPRVKKNNRDIQHTKNTTAPAIINTLLDLGGVFIYY
jgi:hypothetical protein